MDGVPHRILTIRELGGARLARRLPLERTDMSIGESEPLRAVVRRQGPRGRGALAAFHA